jgi:hypothetical protein
MTDTHDHETGEIVPRSTDVAHVAQDAMTTFMTPFSSGPTDKIDKAIAEITSEAAPVLKGGYNDFHKYKYSRIEDYTDVIGPLLGKHGIAVYETSVGRNEIGGMVYVDYAFYISTEGQRIGPLKFTGMARARDSKGNFDPACIAKTLTAARKQFYTAQFHLKTADDADRDVPPRTSANARTPIQPPKEQPLQAGIDINKPVMMARPNDMEWEQWTRNWLQIIRACSVLNTVEAWLGANTDVLDELRKENEPHFQFVMRQYHKRLRELQPSEPQQ